MFRAKDDEDGAEPAGNSVAASNLVRLSRMLDDAAYADRADAIFQAFAPRTAATPTALPLLLDAAALRRARPQQVVLAGTPGAADLSALSREVGRRFLPDAVVLAMDGGEGEAFLTSKAAALKPLKPIGGRATAYVCEHFACQLPTSDPAALGRLLDAASHPPLPPASQPASAKNK